MSERGKKIKHTDHHTPSIRAPKDQIERYTHPNSGPRFNTDTPEGAIPYHWKVRAPKKSEVTEFSGVGPATVKP